MAPLLQLALDDLDRPQALELLARVRDDIDIVEVGTPMLMRYGLDVVGEIKRRFGDLTVLCDAKIMDAAAYEARLAFDAGADWVTFLALTEDASVADLVAAAESGGRVMADLICVPDLAARARTLAGLGVDCLAVHTGVDQQAQGRTPLDDLRTLSAAGSGVPLAVAGGITAASLPDYLALDPAIVIVGSGITRATDPVTAARELRGVLDKSSVLDKSRILDERGPTR